MVNQKTKFECYQRATSPLFNSFSEQTTNDVLNLGKDILTDGVYDAAQFPLTVTLRPTVSDKDHLTVGYGLAYTGGKRISIASPDVLVYDPGRPSGNPPQSTGRVNIPINARDTIYNIWIQHIWAADTSVTGLTKYNATVYYKYTDGYAITLALTSDPTPTEALLLGTVIVHTGDTYTLDVSGRTAMGMVFSSGSIDFKESTRLTTTSTDGPLADGNIPLSGSTPLSIDGKTVTDGNRILLKNQTDAKENGIYVATISGGTYTLARSPDADTDDKVTAGMYTYIEDGTANLETGWVQVTLNPELGTCNLVFTRFSSINGVLGAGAINQVAYWACSDTIVGSSNFQWTEADCKLSIGFADPSCGWGALVVKGNGISTFTGAGLWDDWFSGSDSYLGMQGTVTVGLGQCTSPTFTAGKFSVHDTTTNYQMRAYYNDHVMGQGGGLGLGWWDDTGGSPATFITGAIRVAKTNATGGNRGSQLKLMTTTTGNVMADRVVIDDASLTGCAALCATTTVYAPVVCATTCVQAPYITSAATCITANNLMAYSSCFSISADKDIVYKKYVDDCLSSVWCRAGSPVCIYPKTATDEIYASCMLHTNCVLPAGCTDGCLSYGGVSCDFFTSQYWVNSCTNRWIITHNCGTYFSNPAFCYGIRLDSLCNPFATMYLPSITTWFTAIGTAAPNYCNAGFGYRKGATAGEIYLNGCTVRIGQTQFPVDIQTTLTTCMGGIRLSSCNSCSFVINGGSTADNRLQIIKSSNLPGGTELQLATCNCANAVNLLTWADCGTTDYTHLKIGWRTCAGALTDYLEFMNGATAADQFIKPYQKLQYSSNPTFDNNLDIVNKCYVDTCVGTENIWDAAAGCVYPYGANCAVAPNTSGDLGTTTCRWSNIYVAPVGSIAGAQSTGITIALSPVNIDTFADTAGDGVVWHYVVKNGANLRTGIIMAAWDSAGNTITNNEQSTLDIGDTSPLTFTVDINSDTVRLRATSTTDTWTAKVTRNLL